MTPRKKPVEYLYIGNKVRSAVTLTIGGVHREVSTVFGDVVGIVYVYATDEAAREECTSSDPIIVESYLPAKPKKRKKATP